MEWIKKNFLTNNALKIIACISMLIDHIGYFLFPSAIWLRIVGRLAFPIFAYFIGKGCIYTKDKFKRFVTIFTLAMLCEVFSWKGNVLLVFSLSIILIYAYRLIVDNFKQKVSLSKKIFSVLLFVSLLGIAYLVNYLYPLEYGYCGILFPLIIYMCSLQVYGIDNKRMEKYIDVLSVFVSITFLMFTSLNYMKIFAYLAIPLIACYNHKKGSLNLKYLFYIFYPLHLALLYIISLII